jgi:hypothetical protein
MSPADINMEDCSLLNSYKGYLFYLFSLGLIFSVCLVIRSVRSRQPIVDTENNLSDALFVDTTFLEKPNLGFPHSTILEKSIQDIEFDNPLLDNTLITSTPYTSGFLAARADLERTENPSRHLEVHHMDPKLEHEVTPSSLATKCECSSERCPCNSTRSDAQSNQRPACAFREGAHQDFTEQFQDELDPRVFWRRRTMVFGTSP